MRPSQTLTWPTILGDQPLPAPAGWTFDDTAVLVWAALLRWTRERRTPTKRKRDDYVLDGKIHVLANILSNALGMAPPYWIDAAREHVKAEAEE